MELQVLEHQEDCYILTLLYDEGPGGSCTYAWSRQNDHFIPRWYPDLEVTTNRIALTVYFHHRQIYPPQKFPEGMLKNVLGAASHYEAVCHSSAGTVTWLQEAQSFFFQTPQDDAGLSYSYGARMTIGAVRCVLVSPGRPDELLYFLERPENQAWWTRAPLPLLLIPLRVLQAHVAYTSRTLAGLMRKVSKAEAQILDPSQLKDFNMLIMNLHKYNADLMKLERRWRFERNLSATIREVIEQHKQDWNNENRKEWAPFLADFRQMDDSSMLQEKLSQASEYDLGVLPRRIQNQFTAVYNLMAQRDTKANIRLAMDSQKLATASLRDSSSMKTIAGMTLIFLPPTFICSFFSMSFFNFEATGAKSLWIYFATAAPLTAVVTLSWIAYTTWRRKADQGRIKRRASSGHAV